MTTSVMLQGVVVHIYYGEIIFFSSFVFGTRYRIIKKLMYFTDWDANRVKA